MSERALPAGAGRDEAATAGGRAEPVEPTPPLEPVAGAGEPAPPGGYAPPVEPAPAVEQLSFDVALGQLQEIVSRLEAGGLPLETSLALYERGVALHARCARLLGEAELRVQQLVEQAGGTLAALDLAPDEGDDDELHG